MNNATTRKTTSQPKVVVPGAQRNYNEIVDYLDSHWSAKRSEKNVNAMKALDKAFGNPSKELNTVLVSGTNGKALTINFAATLLIKEGLRVGAFYAPHILTYNEQIVFNTETISNKNFTDIVNDVINKAATESIQASSAEIIAMSTLLYFKQQHADVVLLELQDYNYDVFSICEPKIITITRVTDDTIPGCNQEVSDIIKSITQLVKKETQVVSGDQSKANLQLMAEETRRHNGTWAMPIRKLATLPYPFEQLHGRCAALAERISQLYIEKFSNKSSLDLENSLLAKQKGQRGRPTLEAKRQAELNPKKTIDQFWRETTATLPGHFQLLDKEKPTILLDTARNIDAIQNLLLGVRLLHYQRPLKGLTFIFACDKNQIHVEEFLRLLRYFAKKNSAQVIFCPLGKSIPGLTEESWDVEQITNDVKILKIKARSAANFQEAFEAAKQSVDERHGLVVIAGSPSLIAEYWQTKGIKKF